VSNRKNTKSEMNGWAKSTEPWGLMGAESWLDKGKVHIDEKWKKKRGRREARYNVGTGPMGVKLTSRLQLGGGGQASQMKTYLFTRGGSGGETTTRKKNPPKQVPEGTTSA